MKTLKVIKGGVQLTANPYDKAHELARAIIGSQIFQDYSKAQKIVQQDPETQKKILAFRNNQMEINRRQIAGEVISPNDISEITLEFAKLNKSEDINRFFEAEAAFISLFNDIQEIIRKSIDQEFSG